MDELIQQYLRIHFKPIYRQVEKGPGDRNLGQDRGYFEKLVHIDENGIKYVPRPPYWQAVQVDKKQLYAIIHEFFQICFHAEHINPNYTEIKKWMTNLTCLCCYRKTNDIVSSYAVWQLFAMSEQVTAFIFHTINWSIDPGNQLDGFNARIRFLRKLGEEKNRMKECSQLLYAMKTQRNNRAHTAYNFYTDRQATMQQLIYLLYDYINIYYYIRVILGKGLKDPAKNYIPNPDELASLPIKITCVNQEGKRITDRAYSIGLYQQGGNQVPPHSQENNTACFQVSRFMTYIVKITPNDQTATQQTNPFSIDESYTDHSEVKIIPPDLAQPPQPIIYDIVTAGITDLPIELDKLLRKISQFATQQPNNYQAYLDIVQTLLSAAITDSERDKQNLQAALVRIDQDLAEQSPDHFLAFLRGKAREVQQTLSAPYKTINFGRLCLQIENFYNKYATLTNARHKNHTSLMEQHLTNVRDFLFKGRTTIGTTATQRSIEIEQRLSLLLTLIHLSFHYPEVLKAELGDRDLLMEEITDIYCDAIRFYKSKVGNFWLACHKLIEYAENNQEGDPKHALEPAIALLRSIVKHGSLEELLAYAVKGGNLFRYLFRYIRKTGLIPLELIEGCQQEINNIQSRHYETDLLDISLHTKEQQDVEEQFKSIRTYLDQLETNRTAFLEDIEELKQTVISPEGFLNRLFNYHYNAFSGELQTDYWGKVRYEFLQELMELPAQDILNLMLMSNGKWVFDNTLFGESSGSLGISNAGTWGASSDLYHKYASRNTAIYKEINRINCELREEYQNKPRVRPLANLYETDMDILRAKAHAILQTQIEFIQNIYSDKKGEIEMPAFLDYFIHMPQEIIPDYIKIDVLRPIILCLQHQIYRFYIIYPLFLEHLREALPFLNWMHLRHFFVGEWAQDLYSETIIQHDFPNSIQESKAKYIKNLMHNLPLGKMPVAYCYLLAFRLNFGFYADEEITKEKLENPQYGFIPRHDFFLLMSQFHYNYHAIHNGYSEEQKRELEMVNNYEQLVVYCVSHYCALYPKEKDIWVLHQQQLAELKRTNLPKGYETK